MRAMHVTGCHVRTDCYMICVCDRMSCEDGSCACDK